MPIKSLLSEGKFNSDQTKMITEAFDDAWAKLQSAQTEPAMGLSSAAYMGISQASSSVDGNATS